MRLFVAVAVPAAVRERIAAATRALRAAELPVRWVEPDAFHLTLKFLGEVSAEAAERVAAAVADVASSHAPFHLRLRGAGAFPSARRPSVLWLGVERSAALEALQRDVERRIAPLGFPAEKRPFSPHLTLGRVRREAAGGPAGSQEGALPGAAPLLAAVTCDAEIPIATLDLMKSLLSPRGARYERLLAAELGA